jgi:acyl-CoA thioesterase FadM
MTILTEHRVATTHRPRFEGANIRTWVGFKHFMYLAEEAVLDWFRARGLGPSRLFHDHGLALSIVDSSVQLPAPLDVDDVVDPEVTGGPARFTVRLSARGSTVLRGKLRVVLAPTRGPYGEAPASVPPELAPAVGQIADAAVGGRRDLAASPGADPAAGLAADRPGAHVWSWRVPYHLCQFSRWIQHSGYIRALEEMVERFLAERGLSVATMLDTRGWIPVVSRARVSQLADVAMEETVHAVFAVDHVLRDVGFDGRMDCYVRRGAALEHVATARILHAYALARGPQAGTVARLGPATIAALTGHGTGGRTRP